MAKKNNKRDNRRLKKLIAICVICAVVLVVSTYAWFIGMKTVKVNEFEIEIATTEGLFLSMDGQKWSYKLDVKSATAYDKNANVWADDGLIPMSTVGDMDSEASRMKLFEKGSLTTTPGGYRLLTSRVNNYNNVGASGQQEEGKGYVAFDLFIKNLSGTEYYTENNPLNEEAIYLTTNSAVKVSENGGVDKTGIENSVRVAFAQIELLLNKRILLVLLVLMFQQQLKKLKLLEFVVMHKFGNQMIQHTFKMLLVGITLLVRKERVLL